MKYPHGSRERDGSRASEEAAVLKSSQQEEGKDAEEWVVGASRGIYMVLIHADTCY